MVTIARMSSLLLVAVAIVMTAPWAAAQTTTATSVDEVVEALRSDFIYVDPDAPEPLTDAQIEQLRDAVQQADVGPVYIVVVPDDVLAQAGGDEGAFARDVVTTLERPGVFAFVIGRRFVAGSTGGTPFEEGDVAEVRDAVLADNQGASVATLLNDFVQRLGPAAAAAGGLDIGAGPIIALGALGVGIGGIAVYRRRKKRERERAQVEEVRQVATEDLTSLGNEVYDLEPHLVLPTTPPEAKADYQRATDAFVRARSALEAAQRPADLAQVSAILEEGRFAAATARARIEGKPLPEHRSPCFFDPAHGPSVADVDWTPAGGHTREVPACERDAALILDGRQPQPRQITVAGQERPYYEAPSYYGPWAGGYYGRWGGGGMFDGLLLGSIVFGGPFGWGGWGGGYYGGGYGDGGGGFDGGDFGGGFDPGDFGGDFGGGDFGGGDF